MACAYCTDEGRCLLDFLICDQEDCSLYLDGEIFEVEEIIEEEE